MPKPRIFAKGDQVAYIPNHLRLPSGLWPEITSPPHPDIEFGFVTVGPISGRATVFCRFWFREGRGEGLRTKANSEGCDQDNLVHFESRPQWEFDETLRSLGYKEDTNA